MSKKELDWETLVLISFVILVVIAFFKFLFWISLLSGAVGVIWIAINLYTEDHETSWMPLVLILAAVVVGFISYQIGYGFEKSELGKPIVDSAKTIVQTDNTIKEVNQNISNQLIDSTKQIAGGGSQ